ncbi:hypothetical protein XENOCAPTIV_028897 [Xenoophorus captivus]|uniref:Fibrosin-like 1 n=1 Tax=Xenoophorus captivus TaxID=1517983 RepID=A0ABV0QLB3_9TELE
MALPHIPVASCLRAIWQGPIVCLVLRRGQEDCPRLAAPTMTPGTGFDAHRHLSQPHHSGPKLERLSEAVQLTATTESGTENESEKGTERKEIHPSVKRRRIRTVENNLLNSVLFEPIFLLYRYRDSVDRNRHSNRSSPASAPVSYQISSLIRSNSQNSSDSGRHHSSSVDRVREIEKELLDRQRESSLPDVKVKESRSPGKEMLERRASEDSIKPTQRSPSPYSKTMINEQSMKMAGGLPSAIKDSERKEPPSAELLHKVKNDMKIKEERKEEQEVMVVSSEPAPQPTAQVLPAPVSQPGNPHHHHPPLSQQHPLPSPRGSDIPAPGLHGVPMSHALPLSMSAMPQMGSLNVLDRARMAPFMGVSPLAGRERLPHTAFPWDPLREAYRSLDLQRRMDFQLRAEQGHRFPSVYDQERAYREREAHDYSHHEHLLEVRREHERMRQQAEERERLHLREELDRARLHQLHQSPMEGHLPHMPPFMPHLGGMPYPRLSPSTGHNGPMNRTPPTAALSAPPPLVPAGSARPASPRRTTPLTTTQDPRDYSPSRNPKEVEAR